jgi:hypothetical protein
VDTETKNAFDVVLSAATLLTVLVAGAWAYFRFSREGLHKPRIELDLECDFFGPQQGSYIAAFSVYVHNKGQLKYRFKDIRLRVLGIRRSESLTTWEKQKPLLFFPEQLFKDARVTQKPYIFVRPGVRQRLSYVTSIPEELAFIVARVTFMYPPLTKSTMPNAPSRSDAKSLPRVAAMTRGITLEAAGSCAAYCRHGYMDSARRTLPDSHQEPIPSL